MNSFPTAYLNSNDGTSLLAFGDGEQLILEAGNPFDQIQSFIDRNEGKFIFTCLSYDLKNDIEDLSSQNFDGVQFPKALLWVPMYVVEIDNSDVEFIQGEVTAEGKSFVQDFLKVQQITEHESYSIQLEPRTSKEEYLAHVAQLKEEIQLGNIYEVNYCQEFFAENVEIPEPLNAYFKLNNITKAPYSAYFNSDDFVLMCGSPELYIGRSGNKLTSSPIKGTSKRGSTSEEDELLKTQLLNDPKERSENVMIVDLVRNDLSKIATKNSVQVDELFGIYTFETVHQMISTISCQVDSATNFTDILKATFPMGSMTGAPKISAMQLIEQHEDFKRGLYSGSIGMIAPNGDFDFNVIIRSLIYNKRTQYLSCSVGGAITINSIPENEYEECNVKVKRILNAMNA